MRERTFNVVIVGVGGQGILLTSDILAEVAFEEGYDVKKSEIHGMAQRGGSVISEVRFGEKVYSPLIKKGEADILLALEKLEALRFSIYLKKEGIAIVNNLEIPPLGVNLGKEKYPRDIFSRIEHKISRVIRVEAITMAKKAGSPKTMNVVMLGVLSPFLPFSISSWEKVIKKRVPSYSTEFNIRAFKLGRTYQEQEKKLEKLS
ncbi:indolepyruvate oxidoreductase subunit beta [Candidatus Aerophobetes bacterium]|nr:indolepyruvate oxidoreductase subunit beta [Candidatus Aerophobetes bacterium]